jgi:hypothetical protein
MANNMSTDSLKANLTNPARDYMWNVMVPVPIGNGDTTTYTLRAQSSTIPGRSNEPITIPFMQTAGIQVAGKLAYPHTWACTFIEGEDKKVFDAMYSWQQDIVNDVFGVGVGDPLYKTDVYITLLTTAGDTFMKIKIKGAWVQNMGDVALAYASNDTIKYSVTFAYDSWEDAT